jgi:hypothetical protein
MKPREVLLLLTLFNSVLLGASTASNHHVGIIVSSIAVMAGVIAYGGIRERC